MCSGGGGGGRGRGSVSMKRICKSQQGHESGRGM